ncbi:hypothetical protein [Actinomadura sp. NPDC000929]|uniref:hypothetical protein n=1 Tax=Actinomadura sp. NPDC000929 TaxID=3154517 RepID=UPI0033941300
MKRAYSLACLFAGVYGGLLSHFLGSFAGMLLGMVGCAVPPQTAPGKPGSAERRKSARVPRADASLILLGDRLARSASRPPPALVRWCGRS